MLIHKSMEVNVGDLDEDCYCFLDLFDDAMKAFDIQAGLVLSFQDKKGYFIENDKDILSMFKRFTAEMVIPISVAVVGGPTTCMPPVVEVDDDVESIPEEEFVSNAAEGFMDDAKEKNDPHLDPEEQHASYEPHLDLEEQPASHDPRINPEAETNQHPDPQEQPASQSQSIIKNKSTKKKIEKGGKSSKYRLRKNEKNTAADFVVSDEEYGHYEDKYFDENVEGECSETYNSENDEHESHLSS